MKTLFYVIAFLFLITASGCPVKAQNKRLTEQERYKLAADYSKTYRGLSVLVIKGEKVVFEEYQNGFAADDSYMLASGTKSFSGVIVLMAQEDNLLKLDEKVSDTITEWKQDRLKSKITIRQLLTLTGGIEGGELGRPVAYDEAIKAKIDYEPGAFFQYGPMPFQIFGEVLRRKLAPKKKSVMDYMKRRLFDPTGMKFSKWTMQNEQPNLPSGAFMTAREWAKFGLLIKNGGKWNGKQLVSEKALKECFEGTKTNPNYGLTFWLNRSFDGSAKVAEKEKGRLQEFLGIEPETTVISKNGISKDLPKDMVIAAGAGKQRLYIIPSLDLVIVRQGQQSRFNDAEFLERLILGKS